MENHNLSLPVFEEQIQAPVICCVLVVTSMRMVPTHFTYFVYSNGSMYYENTA